MVGPLLARGLGHKAQLIRPMRCSRSWCGALLLVLATACGDDQGDEGEPAASGGTAGSSAAGVPGAGGSSGEGGSDVATIPLDPPTWVDLEICANINEGDSGALDDCFFCCTDAGNANSGFFDGHCACGESPESEEVCDQAADSDACTMCCQSANYWSASYSPAAAHCSCHQHEDTGICGAQTDDANCAVCCLNAGYVGHTVFNDSCTCSQG